MYLLKSIVCQFICITFTDRRLHGNFLRWSNYSPTEKSTATGEVFKWKPKSWNIPWSFASYFTCMLDENLVFSLILKRNVHKRCRANASKGNRTFFERKQFVSSKILMEIVFTKKKINATQNPWNEPKKEKWGAAYDNRFPLAYKGSLLKFERLRGAIK